MSPVSENSHPSIKPGEDAPKSVATGSQVARSADEKAAALSPQESALQHAVKSASVINLFDVMSAAMDGSPNNSGQSSQSPGSESSSESNRTDSDNHLDDVDLAPTIDDPYQPLTSGISDSYNPKKALALLQQQVLGLTDELQSLLVTSNRESADGPEGVAELGAPAGAVNDENQQLVNDLADGLHPADWSDDLDNGTADLRPGQMSQQNQQLRLQLSQLENQNRQLEHELGEIWQASGVAKPDDRLVALQNQVEVLKSEVDEGQLEAKSNHRFSTEQRQQLQTVQAQLLATEQQLVVSQQTHGKLSTELKTAQNQFNTEHRQQAGLRQQNADLAQKLADSNQQADLSGQKRAQQHKDIQGLELKLQQLNSDNQQLNNRVNQAKTELQKSADVEALLQAANGRVDQLSAEYQNQLQQLQQQLDSAEQRLGASQQQGEQLASELASLQSRSSDQKLEGTITQLQAELAQARQALTDQEQLSSQLATVESELLAVSNQNQHLVAAAEMGRSQRESELASRNDSGSADLKSLQQTQRELEQHFFDRSGRLKSAARETLQLNDDEQRAGGRIQRAKTQVEDADTAIKVALQRTSQTSTAIDQVTATCHDIDDLTGDIKQIAMQSNMLALNASVEAAKAGESGNGFKQVADEVRKLSRRCSSVETQISKLIAVSLERTQNCSDTFNQALTDYDGADQQLSRLRKFICWSGDSNQQQLAALGQLTTNLNQLQQTDNTEQALLAELKQTAKQLQSNARQRSSKGHGPLSEQDESL